MTFEAIRAVITGPEGFSIELFGLQIFRLENGEYAVSVEEVITIDALFIENLMFDREFANVDEAIAHFLMLRNELQLGFDFEVEWSQRLKSQR